MTGKRWKQAGLLAQGSDGRKSQRGSMAYSMA
jgi:hypothetical protein